MTRREWASLVAAQAVAAPVPSLEDAALARSAESVAQLMKMQVTDTKDKAYGGYRDEHGLFWPSSGSGLLDAFVSAFLHPRSKHHKSPEVFERIRMAVESTRRSQNEYGNFNLVITNFNSPPDTGFISLNLGSSAAVAKKYGGPEILAMLEPILRKAGGALAVGGVHTPNHRWVMSGALAQIHSVLPDDRYVKRVDQWLAEGFDIDEDGQWTERSTGVYNPITDTAFVLMADKLKRPELLEPARRNLNSMLKLLHPGYEIVTEFSRRQDLNTKADMAPYYFPLRYLAVNDRNGQYAAIADHFSERGKLSTFMEYPHLAAAAIPHAAIPEDYEQLFKANELMRIRRGLTSATISLEGRDRFFLLRRGDAVINGVRFASAFFGKAQFIPQKWERTKDGYLLSQQLDAGYYQPFTPARRIDAETFSPTREERKRTEICRLKQTALIRELPDGYELTVEAAGTDEVPVAVEINFREGGQLGGVERVPNTDDRWLAPGSRATYTTAKHRIEFGPGKSEHRYVQVRGALPKLPGPSVYLTGATPFRHSIRFRLSET